MMRLKRKTALQGRRWFAALLVLAITLFSLPSSVNAGIAGGSIAICTPDGIVQMAVDSGEQSDPHIETALDGHCAFCIRKQFATLPSPSWDVIGSIVPETRPVSWNGIDIDVTDIGERIPQARPRAPPSSDSDPA